VTFSSLTRDHCVNLDSSHNGGVLETAIFTQPYRAAKEKVYY